MGKDASGTVYSSSEFWGRILESYPSSYTIWKDGTTYRAECNTAGGTDYNGADLGAVINAANDNGGLIFLKLSGTHTYSTSITMPNNKNWVLQGQGIKDTVLSYDGADDAINLDAYTPQGKNHIIKDLYVYCSRAAGYVCGVDLNGLNTTIIKRMQVQGVAACPVGSIGIRLQGAESNGARSLIQNFIVSQFDTGINARQTGLSHLKIRDGYISEFKAFGVNMSGYNNLIDKLDLDAPNTESSTIGIYANVVDEANHRITNIEIDGWFPTEANSYILQAEGGVLYIDGFNIHNRAFATAEDTHIFRTPVGGQGYYLVRNWPYLLNYIHEGTFSAPIALRTGSNDKANFNGNKSICADKAIVSFAVPAANYAEGDVVPFYGFQAALIGGSSAILHDIHALLEDPNTMPITIYGYDDHKTTNPGGGARSGIAEQFCLKVRFYKAQDLSGGGKTGVARLIFH